ncbi:hypothetical protein [Amaricoccus sp. B4]
MATCLRAKDEVGLLEECRSSRSIISAQHKYCDFQRRLIPSGR